MGSELVLLCDREPSRDDWVEEAIGLFEGGTVKRFEGGLDQLLDADDLPVCAWWGARHLENPREAATMLGVDTGAGLWVDMVLPYRRDQPGFELATRVAARVGGQLWRRSTAP